MKKITQNNNDKSMNTWEQHQNKAYEQVIAIEKHNKG